MPEYLAPGVYIEEVSFRAKTIEGVSTSTAGFVGPTQFGPIMGEPPLLTSFLEFQRIYGGLEQLTFGDADPGHNYLAHAVHAFFDEGGQRLYVSRVFRSRAQAGLSASDIATPGGVATYTLTSTESPPSGPITLKARYPGSGGNIQVTFSARVGRNVLASEPLDPDRPAEHLVPALRGVSDFDLVLIASEPGSPPLSPLRSPALYWAERYFDRDARRFTWRFHPETGSELELTTLDPAHEQVRIVALIVQVTYPGLPPQRTQVWSDLSFHPDHPRALAKQFAEDLTSRRAALTIPLIVDAGAMQGPEIARTLLSQPRHEAEIPRLLRLLKLQDATPEQLSILATLNEPALSPADREFQVVLEHGNDGVRPGASSYEGSGDEDPRTNSGLKAFEGIVDISIVAAPGSTQGRTDSPSLQPEIDQTTRHLISHAERMRYRIAVLDSADNQDITTVLDYRGKLDSKHAALYYPWVQVMDPVTDAPIFLPPSGFIAGIYARNDVDNGVHKAPANEVVRGAIGLESLLNKAQQDVLNPEAVNCLRLFEGRGYLVWGARVITSDPEWKYVNLRRYFAYLERSVERGTQWVVFQNNSEALWANVRRTVEDFLFNEWKSGHLMGEKPQEAYFVRCDRSTMTQNDIDNGRLICLVGVAPVRPAEFVIFRIGQWTADAAVRS